MRIYSLACCLLAAPLFSNLATVPDSGSLSSADASYDGNSLVLTGHVVLDHGLGKMTAEEASLQRQETGKDFPFSLIQLRKDVLLALKNSAQISCGSADLDFTALKGTLIPEENGAVVYMDQIKKKKGGESSPLKISAHLIDLLFSKQVQEGKKTEYEIDHILAKEGVAIDYAEDFHLVADHALYRKELSPDIKTSKREFQGILTAYPKDPHSRCRLSHQEDAIDADMVDLNLIHSRLSLLHPKGKLSSSFLPQGQKEGIRFSADHLQWDQPKNTLTLKGHVFIDEETFGTVTAQDELQMTQTTVKGKSALKEIYTQGPSTLIHKDPHGTTHKLVSQGQIHLDHEKLRATIESPAKEGVVAKEHQLYYEENEIAVFSDSAAIEYNLAEETVRPSSLTLKGNIRLFSHDPQKPARCGAADRLTYSLMTRTLILSANPGKKVLFWDEAQGMRLSAPEVHITFDPETKQQSIKGVGAVQFAFTPEEKSKLQQLFPQLEKLL